MQTADIDHMEPSPDLAIHLVLQGKGGVGKTVVASWLAEFLTTRSKLVRCIDGDPVNRSLGQYKALAADKLDLVNDDGLIQRARYDVLLERFMAEDAIFVVDSGATAFMPFWTYVIETEMLRVLSRGGPTCLCARSRKRWGNASGYAPGLQHAGEAHKRKKYHRLDQ